MPRPNSSWACMFQILFSRVLYNIMREGAGSESKVCRVKLSFFPSLILVQHQINITERKGILNVEVDGRSEKDQGWLDYKHVLTICRILNMFLYHFFCCIRYFFPFLSLFFATQCSCYHRQHLFFLGLCFMFKVYVDIGFKCTTLRVSTQCMQQIKQSRILQS